jgi:hypothetical protein
MLQIYVCFGHICLRFSSQVSIYLLQNDLEYSQISLNRSIILVFNPPPEKKIFLWDSTFKLRYIAMTFSSSVFLYIWCALTPIPILYDVKFVLIFKLIYLSVLYCWLQCKMHLARKQSIELDFELWMRRRVSPYTVRDAA